MKKILKRPKKIKQWAEDAMDAMNRAWTLVTAEKGLVLDREREQVGIEFLRLTVPLAAYHRTIDDRKQTQKAWDFIQPRLKLDVEAAEKPSLSMLFLLGYLDAHVAWGYISEMKHHEIMEYILAHYEAPQDFAGV